MKTGLKIPEITTPEGLAEAEKAWGRAGGRNGGF